MLKDAVIPTTQTRVSAVSAQIPRRSRPNVGENLSADARNEQDDRRGGHGSEQLDLMMEQAAVVQNADDGDKRRARVNADHLRQRGAVHRHEQRDQHAQINRQAAEQRHRLDVHFARARMIHHPDAQRELPHRNGEPHGGNQANSKCNQARIHEKTKFSARSASP